MNETPKFLAHILIVDDYLLNREMARKMVELSECDVDTAEDAATALELLEETTYDLIFMDVQMPVINGLELTKIIRNLEKKKKQYTPIVAITANTRPGAKEECLSIGMDDYISKPFTKNRLVQVLSKFLQEETSPTSCNC